MMLKRRPHARGGEPVRLSVVCDQVAVDQLDLLAGRRLERIGRDTVDVAQLVAGGFVQDGQGFAVEEAGLHPRVLKSVGDVFSGVLNHRRAPSRVQVESAHRQHRASCRSRFRGVMMAAAIATSVVEELLQGLD